jgi:hypothetical protein
MMPYSAYRGYGVPREGFKLKKLAHEPRVHSPFGLNKSKAETFGFYAVPRMGQGLTLVVFSAQPEVFLIQNSPSTPSYP